MNRKIVILNECADNAQNVVNTVRIIMANSIAPEIVVYTRAPDGRFCLSNGNSQCYNETIPGSLDTEPKVRNWINTENAGFDGFLHVITDSVEILKDPSQFISELENAMRKLDYPVWLNTACDNCNFIYSKYNPRLRVSCDRAECAALGLSGELCFTSHSNTQWVAYDMPALCGSDLLRFEERFTIPMFFIIEFLARRRNTRPAGSLFYMNQYLTVGSEIGTFRNLKNTSSSEIKQDIMRAEDEAFKALGVDFQSDNNIDAVLETLWEKILAKTRKSV